DEIQESVSRLTLSRSHALELMRLPTAELQLEVARKIPGRLTREETRKLVDSLLKDHDNAGSQREHTSSDPLADLWAKVAANPMVPKGNWHVGYSGNGTWHISVTIPGPMPQDPMVQWFESMVKAMPDVKKKVQKLESLAAKYGPKTPA